MRSALALLCVVLAGCALKGGSTQADPAASARTEWSSLVAQASQEASAGRFGVADRMLADYTSRYPASAEGAESMFWRALFKLDPSNPNASNREAATLLDSYLGSGTGSYRAEAATLRRVVTALEAKPMVVQGPANKPTEVAPAPDKAKDDEIARLKDELARANAELERIKKRLTQPTKP